MSARLWRIIVILLAFPCVLPAVEVHLAPLGILDEAGGSDTAAIHPEFDLTHSFAGLAAGALIDLYPAEVAPGGTVRSLLDATRLCQAQGYGLLLYGFLKRGTQSYSAEVKLFDAEKGAVAASFFAADDGGHYERLMHDLASRILDFFTNDPALGITSKHAAPERNLIAFPMALGYWTPAGGGWKDVLTGLASATLGFRFVPLRPLFTFLSRDWQIALGLEADYELGMNQPGYESFFLHAAHVRFPIELGVDLGAGNLLAASVGPLLSVDVLSQDRLYSSPYVGVTAMAGISGSITYRYEASDFVSLGCTTIIDVAFYATPLVTVSPRFFVELTPGRTSGGGQP